MDGTENPPNDSTEELTALEVLLSKWEPAEVKIDSIEKRVTFERFATKSHYLVNSGFLINSNSSYKIKGLPDNSAPR